MAHKKNMKNLEEIWKKENIPLDKIKIKPHIEIFEKTIGRLFFWQDAFIEVRKNARNFANKNNYSSVYYKILDKKLTGDNHSARHSYYKMEAYFWE